MNKIRYLSLKQTEEIKHLASEIRRSFGIVNDIPIANDIFMLLDKKGIILCQYPFKASEGSHTDATITWFEMENEPLTFIGLNTAIYYDEQIFAVAHELYHYITKSGKAYDSDLEEEDQLTERKADRFAAELLLPHSALESLIVNEFDSKDLREVPIQRIIRFLARLQCEWCLPYHSLVKRLLEEGYLEQEQYATLYQIDDRDKMGNYARICNGIDSEKYQLLNNKTNKKGISGKVMEIMIQNYEDGYLTDDEFVNLLALFEKTPSDFGFDLSISNEDLDDLENLYGGGTPREG